MESNFSENDTGEFIYKSMMGYTNIRSNLTNIKTETYGYSRKHERMLNQELGINMHTL